ncbi:MAG: SH3 domain-containing protein [Anaerolineales bacterium]|nr:SH3 domain-containing protein [Anaerolineales bacterium]NUQ85286.1 SH3 domain-containing protein [Anaerolineales bacterium]
MFKTQNLYQNDEKWKNTKLGNSSETIGGWGCLLTSVTMMLNGIGYNETPETVNEKMKKAGGFQGAFFIPSVLPFVWSNCAYRDMQPCENSPAPVAQIDAAVAAGKPVILQVDWNKQAGIQTHFVLVKEKKGNDYVLYDPYKYGGDSPDKEVLLTTRYKYNGATLESEISAVLWFDSYSVAPPEPPKMTKVPVPADKYILYAAEDDLALRAEPNIGGYLWKRLIAGAELICLEPKATAKAKLGVNGQWINVQDPAGDQGYVAAWYVSETKGGPPAPAAPKPASTLTTSATPKPAPAAPPAPLPAGAMLFVPTEELAFRSKPEISPETLIRRIPVTEQLVSLEPANFAIEKVGVVGKWLKVRDSQNKEGFVAAWYVKFAGGSTAQQGIAAAPTAAVTTMPSANAGKVKAAAQAVAFRKQPLVSDSTLIRWLPLGEELTIAEPGGETKIGANNQWLQVKDRAGMEGYVAAWFVSR